MIPKPYIAKWKDNAPWNSFAQVEQDLVISRTLIELFSDEFIRENLAFRGGTALHKLYLLPASRYSEDIDLVQIKEGPIGPVLTRLDEVISFFEEDRVVKQKANNNTIVYRFASEYLPETRLRLKIEINCREHFSVLGWQQFPFEVASEWFAGKANITTYDINELLGTKLRALYQRKKGRDLFDLYYADQNTELNYDQIIDNYDKYIGFVVDKPPTKKQFLVNLEAKQGDSNFAGDIEGLLRPEVEYDQDKAFDWVRGNLVEKLKFLPDSVTVTGPKKYIDSIQEVKTTFLKLENVSQNLNLELKLQPPSNSANVILSANKVKITGIVSKFTEGIFTIPVAIINKPKGIKVTPFPNEIEVVYQSSLINFNKISTNSFSVVFDYNQYKNDTLIQHLTPIIKQKSAYISSIKIIPNQIKFLIQK